MATAKKATKAPVRSNRKRSKNKLSRGFFKNKSMVWFGLAFASIGAIMLIRSFAASIYVEYFGVINSTNQSAEYTLSTGTGTMSIVAQNNTGDLLLTVSNSSGSTVGSIMAKPKPGATLNLKVNAGTYKLKLTTKADLSTSKGYKLKITYPEAGLVAPSVVISKPLNSESVSGTVTFLASAKDDKAVSRVDFYANDTLLKSDDTSNYSVPWDTTAFANGTVVIKAKAFDSDGLSSEASGTVTVKNTTTATQRFPGDPNPKVSKKAYWGASIESNGDPVSRFENATGTSLAIRRTFWQWDNATNLNSNMYKTIVNDLANNRLPFISVKGEAWKDMGSGKYDAEIDKMLKQLDSYGKPIWLVFNHEPEGGCKPNCAGPNGEDDVSGAPGWRSMQIRIRQRMTAVGTKNVAFMPILMSYTWKDASGRNPSDWWVDGIWDAYCVDHYNDTTNGSALNANWTTFTNWVEAKNIPYCIGEWGNRGTDATTANEMQAFWDWSFDNKKDLVAYSYFDSSQNSDTGAWTLTGEPFTKFKSILKSDTRVQRINDLK
ncbi:MAG: Ig-like domain-containing protein [Candidatus Saccharibacteria bacterium]|nr:Ig-like domain-containing protein [Candidatus Saccharibacteria bacterium]